MEVRPSKFCVIFVIEALGIGTRRRRAITRSGHCDLEALALDIDCNGITGMRRGCGHQQRGEETDLLHDSLHGYGLGWR